MINTRNANEVYAILENVNSRRVLLPKLMEIAGVESDENVRSVKFKFPKIVDGVDLTEMQLKINFMNGRQEKGQYLVTDLAPHPSDENYVTFSWNLSRLVTRYRGVTKFIVCAVKTDEDGKIVTEWNTSLSQMRVLEGLEVEEPEISPEEKDVIAGLISICQSSVDEAAVSAKKAEEEAEKVFTYGPTIGENGNWYIAGEDTGKSSRGEKGDPGTASVAINDSVTNLSQTWSSKKINEEIHKNGIVKCAWLINAKWEINGSIVSLPSANTRIQIVYSDGTSNSPYGNWDKQEYDLSSVEGKYLVYKIGDAITRQQTSVSKGDIVLFAYNNYIKKVCAGYLFESHISSNSPIVNILTINPVEKYPITYTNGIPSTVTFPSSYKFKILKENGESGTYYISGSGQNVFTVNDEEKLICEKGIFKVVPLSYSSENAIDFLIIIGGHINGGYLFELEQEKIFDSEIIYATCPSEKINIKYNEDGSITLSNPLATTTFAKKIYINTKIETQELDFSEDFVIPKSKALIYNSIEKSTKLIDHPLNDTNGYLAKLDLTPQDLVLAHNINGKLADGFFVQYVEKAKEDILDIKIPSKYLKYTSIGSVQGICIIEDELWLCSNSNDEHTDFANIKVVNKNTFVEERKISHNLGHLNTLSYNADNDCLITSNSSKSYSLPPKVWIYPNWKTQSSDNELNFNTLEKIELDFSWLYEKNGESKANPVWGENLAGRNNIIYMLTNDNTIIRKILLGKGGNDLGTGVFTDGKNEDEYNGTYKIIDTWSQFDGLGVNADVVFHKGKLYTAGRFEGECSGCYVYQLKTRGNIKKSILQIHNYDEAGNPENRDGQGVELDGDSLYFFTDGWGVVIDINSID